MINFISDAITTHLNRNTLTPVKDPIVSVGKPPALTNDAYLSFLQGRYEIATSNPAVSKEAIFEKLSNKLEDLRNLNDDWDKDGAEAPNFESIDKAREILKIISNKELVPTNVSPSVEGGISIYFMKGNKYADIECFNSGEVLTSKADRINEPEVTELYNENDIKAFLEQIKSFLND